MNYVIEKNFLEESFFKDFKDFVINSDFNWYQKHKMVYKDKLADLGYFTHSFFNDNNITSPYYNTLILPMLNKLKAISVIQVRANLIPSAFFLNRRNTEYHTDYNVNSTTAILYLNTCDGGTELKVNDQEILIQSEENKMLIFDTQIPHRSVKPTNSHFRYFINFNYFKNNDKR